MDYFFCQILRYLTLCILHHSVGEEESPRHGKLIVISSLMVMCTTVKLEMMDVSEVWWGIVDCRIMTLSCSKTVMKSCVFVVVSSSR